MYEETLGGEQPVAQRLVCGSGRLFRFSLSDHGANEEPAAGVSSRDRIDLRCVDTMGNPFLLPIVTRILARRVAHHPQWSDPGDLVRERAAPAGAVPAYKHFDRELDFPALTCHE